MRHLFHLNLHHLIKDDNTPDHDLNLILSLLESDNDAIHSTLNEEKSKIPKKEKVSKKKTVPQGPRFSNPSGVISPKKKNTGSSIYKKRKPLITPTDFDPNTVSKEDLKKMKIPFVVINTLDKYRNKGGTFKRKEDVKKIYGLTDSVYQIYISFQLAKVIIRYREQHGAFKKVEDLRNIKILSSEKLTEIKPYLRV